MVLTLQHAQQWNILTEITNMKLYGASGHAKVIIDILNACNINISEIYDDNHNEIVSLHGINVCQPQKQMKKL